MRVLLMDVNGSGIEPQAMHDEIRLLQHYIAEHSVKYRESLRKQIEESLNLPERQSSWVVSELFR